MRKIKVDKLNKLGKQRNQSGYEREEAAKLLGCTTAHLCKIEKIGTLSKPSLALLEKMCEIYGCTLNDLFSNPQKSQKCKV